jgi:hypothetical protein
MYLGNGTLNNRKNQQHCQHKIENIGGKRNICKDRRDFKVHNIHNFGEKNSMDIKGLCFKEFYNNAFFNSSEFPVTFPNFCDGWHPHETAAMAPCHVKTALVIQEINSRWFAGQGTYNV